MARIAINGHPMAINMAIHSHPMAIGWPSDGHLWQYVPFMAIYGHLKKKQLSTYVLYVSTYIHHLAGLSALAETLGTFLVGKSLFGAWISLEKLRSCSRVGFFSGWVSQKRTLRVSVPYPLFPLNLAESRTSLSISPKAEQQTTMEAGQSTKMTISPHPQSCPPPTQYFHYARSIARESTTLGTTTATATTTTTAAATISSTVTPRRQRQRLRRRLPKLRRS